MKTSGIFLNRSRPFQEWLQSHSEIADHLKTSVWFLNSHARSILSNKTPKPFRDLE